MTFMIENSIGCALAKELKVNPTNLTEKLASLGIQPIHGPNIDQTRSNIF